MNQKLVALIVAHPDDETLWAGGAVLEHPAWNWFILSLTRKSDLDRSGKFYKALEIFRAKGKMADLDDGPEQYPLKEGLIGKTILKLLPPLHYDLIITHSPAGEYTRHLRHEETGNAVISLWKSGNLAAKEMWTFAYEDGGKQYFPRAIKQNTSYEVLAVKIWRKKYNIITQIYGFDKDSWEAKTTPREESFRIYNDPNSSVV